MIPSPLLEIFRKFTHFGEDGLPLQKTPKLLSKLNFQIKICPHENMTTLSTIGLYELTNISHFCPIMLRTHSFESFFLKLTIVYCVKPKFISQKTALVAVICSIFKLHPVVSLHFKSWWQCWSLWYYLNRQKLSLL